VWIASYPDGAVRKLTTDLANYYSVDASKDGRTLIAVQQDFQANLWIVPARADAPRQITDVKYGRPGYVGIDWTPDGRIVYTAMPSGHWDLWITDANGSNARQLTDDPGVEANPSVTPDGSEVVFLSRPGTGRTFEIRAISIQGGTPRTIVGNGRVQPGHLRVTDGFVYFTALDNDGQQSAWRVPLAGGEPEPAFKDRSILPTYFNLLAFSPDERLALGPSLDEVNHRRVLAIVSRDGSAPRRIVPYPAGVQPAGDGRDVRWSPDGSALEYLRRESQATNLWRAPLDGRAPAQITSFAAGDVMNWAWARDGHTLALTRGSQSSDLVLITSKGGK
jgi:Tol biopolymer transport system component